MAGKRKRIPRESSSEASTDNPQIRAAVVIPSSNTVAAVISSVNTQGSATGEPKKKRSKTRGKNSDKLQEQLGGLKIPITLTKLKGKPTEQKHFDSFPTLEEAKQNKHEDVTSQEEWNFLCDRYASVQFKEHSNKNAINRSHLTYNHKGGSKSFRAHEEEIEAKTGEQLSAIDYFEVVHKNTKNGWDEGAKLKWEEMLSRKNETTFPNGTMMLTDDEIVIGVLGHKSGYFKGPSKFVSREDTMLDKHLEEKLETQQQELVTTKQELVETKQELGEAKQEIQELKENQKKFEVLLHKIMEGQQPPP